MKKKARAKVAPKAAKQASAKSNSARSTRRAPSKPKRQVAASGSNAVEEFVTNLEHPRKDDILALRRAILAVDASIDEGIQWNTLSFKTREYFATIHLRAKEGVQLILHLGAKKRENAKVEIEDPSSLLKWLDPARATIVFRDRADLASRGAAFAAIVRQWLRFV